MVSDLLLASRGEKVFPADEYINRFSVKKHDHVSIPAGTVHCSGANTMVLEISATPYIFTFKLWDWNRVDLNGRPRPLHLEHGLRNLRWERDADWVEENLLVAPEVVASAPGVIEERTGLHDFEFLETHRVWFSEKVQLHTNHTVTVMTLIEGDLIEIQSPDSSFASFPLRYGETVILPAGVGEFTLVRSPLSGTKTFGTIRAWCRE
jgi:mannose-6-phosphate isomerase class I